MKYDALTIAKTCYVNNTDAVRTSPYRFLMQDPLPDNGPSPNINTVVYRIHNCSN